MNTIVRGDLLANGSLYYITLMAQSLEKRQASFIDNNLST